jgi:hypothetical protein
MACKGVNGVLVLLAGYELFSGSVFAGLTGLQMAGVLFMLFGVSKLVHALGLCPCCKDGCCGMKKK